MSRWTEHSASNGRLFYYDAETGRSVWERPAEMEAVQSVRPLPTLRHCLESDERVAAITRAILSRCGLQGLPAIKQVAAEEPLCADRRGAGYCCATNRVYMCSQREWVSCRELAYELSHAYNVCTGKTRCAPGGVLQDGQRCGYFSPPDLACSEIRAAYWTGRCARRSGDHMLHCLEYHARWAIGACFPRDEYADAHVRYARNNCIPEGREARLTGEANGRMSKSAR